jgi:hypothetical protein
MEGKTVYFPSLLYCTIDCSVNKYTDKSSKASRIGPVYVLYTLIAVQYCLYI